MIYLLASRFCASSISKFPFDVLVALASRQHLAQEARQLYCAVGSCPSAVHFRFRSNILVVSLRSAVIGTDPVTTSGFLFFLEGRSCDGRLSSNCFSTSVRCSLGTVLFGLCLVILVIGPQPQGIPLIFVAIKKSFVFGLVIHVQVSQVQSFARIFPSTEKSAK